MNGRQELAKMLHADGLSQASIAELFRVSPSTACRWLNAESHRKSVERGRAWKAANPERRKEGDKAWRERTRHRCATCPRMVLKHCETCRDCVAAGKVRLYLDVEAMWNDGLSMREICERLGMSTGYLASSLARARGEGYFIPHRHKPWVNETIAA